MKKKVAFLSVLLVVLVAVEAFLLVWLFGADYRDFDSLVREEAPIPGLSDGISPQGLCALPENDGGYRYAMSGYLKGQPSRVYLFGGSEKYIVLTDGDREISTHFGGIAYANGALYIADGKGVAQISLSDALSAENGGRVPVLGRIDASLRSAAFCYCFDDTLFIGEFYRPKNYETDESHRLSVGGEINPAIVYLFRGTENGFGTTPYAALSVRAQVQGIAVWEDGIALSTSYGLPDSKIYLYPNVLKGEPQGTFEGLPLYRLDSSNQQSVLSAPCMSEEIFYSEGRLYLLFESKSKKYKYFVRRQIGDVLSVAVSALR